MEVAQILLRNSHRFGFIFHHNVDDTILNLHVERADFGRSEDAEATSFDHRRAAHADIGTLGSNDDITASKKRSVTREAVARRDANERHQTAQPTEEVKRQTIETGTADSVGVTRTTTAAFREQHHRQPVPFGQFE